MKYDLLTQGYTGAFTVEEYKQLVEECESLYPHTSGMEVWLACECAALAYKKDTGRELAATDELVRIVCAAYCAGKVVGKRHERERRRRS